MSPSRSLLLPLLVVALALPASGSTIEEATGGFVSYQFDGDTGHDAPDLCGQADPEWSLGLDSTTDGMLVAPDDVSDVFVVDVPSEGLGDRLRIELSEVADLDSLQMSIFAPGCATTVLDPLNWPEPEPTPPAPLPGQRQESVDNLDPRTCDSTRWEFWADTYPSYTPPSSIFVAWTDGSTQTVPLSANHGIAHAIYRTTHALDVTVKDAWINMPATWSGSFVLAIGPCDAQPGGAVYGDPPLAGMGFIEFAPIQAGRHVVQVTYEGELGDLLMPIPAPATIDPEPYLPVQPGETVHDLLHGLDTDPSDGLSVQLPGPIVVPASCHLCLDGLDKAAEAVSYLLSAFAAG